VTKRRNDSFSETVEPSELEPDEETRDEPGDTASPGSSALEQRIVEAEAERDEYLALAQRAQADFENYRKRAVRDQERLVAHAHERLVRELLPVPSRPARSTRRQNSSTA